MTIKEITSYLDEKAPPALQESYDNAGLLVGNPQAEATGALLCLDSTEEVIQEAIAKGINLVIAHHPIVFGGLKRFTGRNYVERTVMMAIKNDIAIYCAHTNLDNVRHGVNARIAQKLGLEHTQILAPKPKQLKKLFTFCPVDHVAELRKRLFEAGCGHIGNYDSCSFNTEGYGTFRALEGANPFVGNANELHKEPELKVEAIFDAHLQNKVIAALRKAHPYEEVAFDIIQLENTSPEIGAGQIGTLPQPMEELEFLRHLKATMKAGVVRYTKLAGKPVQKVAVCGGTGSFLLGAAQRQKADVFITADFKYHEFFDAEGKIVIADIGHYESEQFTMELFSEFLQEKFPTFASHFTDNNTNPVQYL